MTKKPRTKRRWRALPKCGVDFLVKIQRPLGGNAARSLLVYNEDRSLSTFLDYDSPANDVAGVLAIMGTRSKVYLTATLSKSGLLRVNPTPQPDPGW